MFQTTQITHNNSMADSRIDKDRFIRLDDGQTFCCCGKPFTNFQNHLNAHLDCAQEFRNWQKLYEQPKKGSPKGQAGVIWTPS